MSSRYEDQGVDMAEQITATVEDTARCGTCAGGELVVSALDKALRSVRDLRAVLDAHDTTALDQLIADAEQRGREDNTDHGMCYVSGSTALDQLLADARREALLDAAENVPMFEFMLPMDVAAEVAPGQIAAWLRDRGEAPVNPYRTECATCSGRGVWMDEPCHDCQGPTA